MVMQFRAATPFFHYAGLQCHESDGDGDEVLVVVTNNLQPEFPRVLFRNDTGAGGAQFARISSEDGLNDTTVSRCLAIFDYDADSLRA